MRRNLSFSKALIVILFWSAGALAQTGPSPTSACLSQTTNLGQLKTALLDYERSGGYERDIKTTVDGAKTFLAKQSARKGNLAIVLDIDETSLSNWPELNADDFGYFRTGPCNLSADGSVQAPCGWNQWVELAKARPIEPTLELYRQARAQGLHVFFITARSESQRLPTAANLRAAGYEGWSNDDLKMKPDDLHRQSVAPFKTDARRRIAEQGYTVVLNMGDQDSDLTGGYAERTFKLPNPFYYIP